MKADAYLFRRGCHLANRRHSGDEIMLRYALMFFAIAIVAGLLGFGGVMGTSAWIARLFFVGFLIIAVVSLFTGRRIRTDL